METTDDGRPWEALHRESPTPADGPSPEEAATGREGSSSGEAPRELGNRVWKTGVGLLVGGILLALAAPTIADPDLWGHVRFGQLTVRLGGPARLDPFSYLTGTHPWINHEWLSEVIFAGVWRHFHTAGLIALKTAVVLLILGLVYRRLVRSGPGLVRGAAIVVALSPAVLLGLGTVRPQMFTYLGFTLTLLCLAAAEEGRERYLWLLPPLFALWANLHGGVLAGAGVVGMWAVVHVVSWVHSLPARRRTRDAVGAPAGAGPRLRLVLFTAAASAAALLLTPYGARLPLFLLRTATVPRPDIGEWQGLHIQSALGLLYLSYVAATAWTLWRTPRRTSPALMAILAVVMVLPLAAVRHLPLFCLAIGILLAPHLAAVWGPSRSGKAPASRLGPWLGLAAGLVGIAAAARSAGAFRCIEMGSEHGLAYPARAIGLLERSGAQGRLAIYFDWGEYAIWHLAPRFEVGMDGRRETVYPRPVYRSYLDWVGGVDDWSSYLGRGPADLALVPRDRPVYNLMSLEPEWPLVYQDTLVAVFGRRGDPATLRVRKASPPDVPVDGSGMCFP